MDEYCASGYNKVHIRMNLPFIILWEIWKTRNESKFKRGKFNTSQIIWRIVHHIWTITKAWGWQRNQWRGDLSVILNLGIFAPPKNRQIIIGKWIRSNQHLIKFNVDGSRSGQESSSGGVARDNKNRLVLAFFEYLGNYSILEAELHVIYRALFFCQTYRLVPCLD